MKCLFFKYFYILIGISFMLEAFYIISVVLRKIIAIKDAIIHLKKVMFLLR